MSKVVFIPPFRVGRKQGRAVLDANGRELVVFPVGQEQAAKEYCDFLNSMEEIEKGFLKEEEREVKRLNIVVEELRKENERLKKENEILENRLDTIYEQGRESRDIDIQVLEKEIERLKAKIHPF